MVITCDIKLFKPTDGVFVPGEIVAGVIKYVVDKDTLVTQTTVSLKGVGYLKIRDRIKRRKNRRYLFTNVEEYVDTDQIKQRDLKGAILPIGEYETNFHFQLPKDIPQTFNYADCYSSYSIRCQILYYIRIKFGKPGLFKLNKHYRKEINVVSYLRPRLPTTPSDYIEQKKLFKLFTTRPHIVHIKANVESCVVPPGGKIELNYEVHNDTTINIKSVETKLIEVHTFKAVAHKVVKVATDVPYTETKTSQINSGETQTMLIVINVPPKIHSIEDSKVVMRDFFIKITAELPTPHHNAILEVPVQIGVVKSVVPERIPSYPPPTYWESMGEQEVVRDHEET